MLPKTTHVCILNLCGVAWVPPGPEAWGRVSRPQRGRRPSRPAGKGSAVRRCPGLSPESAAASARAPDPAFPAFWLLSSRVTSLGFRAPASRPAGRLAGCCSEHAPPRAASGARGPAALARDPRGQAPAFTPGREGCRSGVLAFPRGAPGAQWLQAWGVRPAPRVPTLLRGRLARRVVFVCLSGGGLETVTHAPAKTSCKVF